MPSSAVDCAAHFSVHALEVVFSKWLIVCELWSLVQIHIIIICWDTECEQYTLFARSEVVVFKEKLLIFCERSF
jgi:hypothetical protein